MPRNEVNVIASRRSNQCNKIFKLFETYELRISGPEINPLKF